MHKFHLIRPCLLVITALAHVSAGPFAASLATDPPKYELKQLVGDPSFRHAGSVTSLRVFDGGRRVLSASQDGSSRIWDAQTGKELHRFMRDERDDVWCAVVSADGKYLLDCGDDQRVTVWKLADRSVVRQLKHDGTVFRLALTPDGKHVAASDRDNKVVLWNFVTGAKVRAFEGHKEGVYGVAVSPDGKRLATASDDSTAKLWDLETGEVLHTFDQHKNDVYTVAFSPDSSRLVSVGGDDHVRLWSVADGKPAWAQKMPHDARVAKFSPDGTRIAVGLEGGAVALLNADDGHTLRTLDLPKGTPWPVAFSPDGKTVWANAEYLICRLDLDGDVATGPTRPIAPLKGFAHVAAVADGRGARVAGGNAVWRWPGKGDRLERAFVTGTVIDLQATPKGDGLLVHTGEHEARLYDASTGEHRRTLKAPSGNSSQVWRWSSDGASALVIDKGRSVRFDAATGALISAMPENPESNHPHAVAADRAGSRVAVAEANPVQVRLYDALAMREQGQVALGFNDVDHLALAGHGGVMLVADGKDLSQWGRPAERVKVKHTPAQIKRWVAELGHNSYVVRETATRALIEAGDAAKEALKQADRNDPEVEARLARIERGKAADNLPNRQVGDRITFDIDIQRLVVHPDERRWAAIAGTDAHARVIIGKVTSEGPALLQQIDARHGPASLAFSADGRMLYVANRNGTMSVYHSRETK